MQAIRRIEQVRGTSLTIVLPDTFKGPGERVNRPRHNTLTPTHHRTVSGDNT